MKAVKSYMLSLACVWNLRMLAFNLISFCVLALSVLTSADREIKSVLSQVVGGIRIIDYEDFFPAIAVGKWLFLTSVFLLNVAIFIENEVSLMGAYVIPRYASYRKWWTIKVSQVFFQSLVYVISGTTFLVVFQYIFPLEKIEFAGFHELPVTIICLITHLFLIGTLMVSMFVVTYNRMISVIAVIAFEGITLIIGIMNIEISRYMPSMWGMFLRSTYADLQTGFDPAIVIPIQVVTSVAIIVFVPALLRRRGMAAVLS